MKWQRLQGPLSPGAGDKVCQFCLSSCSLCTARAEPGRLSDRATARRAGCPTQARSPGKPQMRGDSV